MQIYSSPHYDKKFRKLIRHNFHLEQIVKEKLAIFIENRNDPSLKTHKLIGEYQDRWSISLAYDMRLIFKYIEAGILLIDISKHEDVY